MKQSAVAAKQFGETASAYLTSAVHAQGEDLNSLRAVVGNRPAATVLDLGCGGGHASFAVAPVAASVIACDLSPQMLDVVASAAQQRGFTNITVQQAQAESLPFGDDAFDIVMTRFSAHHWSDVEAGLREAYRVLKPDGVMIVIDIVSPEPPLLDTMLQAVELLRDASHVRDYRVSEWQAMLGAAGFVSQAPQQQWTLKMVFADWIARMRTPPDRVAAIRSLFDGAPDEVRAHFAVEQDHSFTIDSAFFATMKK